MVFFAPEMGGLFLEAPNFEPANPLLTPEHIAPVWYFTPYYAILRAVPAFLNTQVWGVLALFAAVLLLFFIPWLDRSPVKSIRYRGPIYKTALMIFAANFIMLGYCGLKPAVAPFTTMSVIGTIIYFAFFLLMPWYSRIDKIKPEPATGDEVSALSRFAAAVALSFAAAANASTAGWPLQEAGTDVSNLASLQRGARNFVNYCLGCHSAKYMRYSQLAEDLALTEDDLRTNLMFTGTRVYDPMVSAMSAEQGRQWFGNAPPDLSLIARSRGSRLRVHLPALVLRGPVASHRRQQRGAAGYGDAARARAAAGPAAPALRDQDRRGRQGAPQHLVGLEPGSLAGDMPAAAFDSFVRDTVAFLEYVSEPHKAKRQALGVWVILFLLMFAAFAWFLYKEYWKDVK